MLITSETSTSVLYDTLNHMGMLSSEERHIRIVREESENDSFFTDAPLSILDINRVGYLNPHFVTKPEYKGKLEVWVNNEYQHPDLMQWITNDFYLYGVLLKNYDPNTTTAKVIYNPGIIFRYSKTNTTKSDTRKYTFTMDLTKDPYSKLDNPDRAVYYIDGDTIKTPTVTWLSETKIQFDAPYSMNIDFFVCNNLAGIFIAKKGIGLYVDNPHNPVCYHHIIVDGDPSYHIDARFYPAICVDKDCIVRVYNDSYHEIPYPDICRLVNYPEYADILDPYNSGNEYLRTLKEVDDVISKTDSDEIIHKKFLRIVRFCYRIWEGFPKFSDEVSDFVICDNQRIDIKYFKSATIYTNAGSYEAIYSIAPFESHRDILFYQGMLYSDYKIINLAIDKSGKVIESSTTGIPRYVLDANLDPDLFTLVKFNAWEDTNLINLGDYIDPALTAQLHEKMNRFYRNLLVVRGQILPEKETQDDYARIMTSEPTMKDEYLWFELLTNVNPDQFKEDTQLIINLYGVNGELIPEDVKAGAYMLELDPKDGPASYTDLLMTYYQLSKAEKKYLALQYKDNEPDPSTKVFYDLTIGKSEEVENPTIGLHVEDDKVIPPYHEEVVDIGTVDQPDLDDRVLGDLYFQVDPEDSILSNSSLGLDDDSSVMVNLQDMTFDEREAINRYSRSDKISYILSYINDMDDLNLKTETLLAASDEELDKIIVNILKTKYVYDIAKDSDSISTMNASLFSNSDEIIQHNVKYILSNDEPTEPEINDMWIQLDEVPLDDYIQTIISHELLECSSKYPKNPYYDGKEATMVLDYGAHNPAGTGPEIFQEYTDPTLRKINYDKRPENPADQEIWYEYLDEINDRVCYYDEETMVLRVDERLLAVRFAHDNITAFMFDDIVLNFRGRLGIKYLSILADLVNSGVIKQEELNIFYQRLITGKDHFNLDLRRLYTGTSHVISTTNIDTTDFSVMFSKNVKRFTINYWEDAVSNREREAAYRMCIDYSNRDFAYLSNRMLVFINGKYIPRINCKEAYAQKLQILNFDEVISTVDILYSEKDMDLIKLKKSAYAYWPLEDISTSIQRPERDYGKIVPIDVYDGTLRGYYDILLDEYIFNGKLMRILTYLQDHPEEAATFCREIVQQFHAISDKELSTMTEWDDPRIIICGNGEDQPYTIMSNE